MNEVSERISHLDQMLKEAPLRSHTPSSLASFFDKAPFDYDAEFDRAAANRAGARNRGEFSASLSRFSIFPCFLVVRFFLHL